MWKCEVCGVGPEEPVFRNGPAGPAPRFRCWKHLDKRWKDMYRQNGVKDAMFIDDSLEREDAKR